MANKNENEPRNIRLSPDRRATFILNKSIELIGKYGFSVTLREIASYSGVSAGLVIKYFGSKENLINRVFDIIFNARWDEKRLTALTDRSVDLRTRLKRFYIWFFEITDDYNWIRTGIFSGLSNGHISSRHYELQVRRIIEAIALEVRHERGDDDPMEDSPPEMWELEVAWSLHSTFIQWTIRNHVFARPVWDRKTEMVDLIVDLFLDGCKATSRTVADN